MKKAGPLLGWGILVGVMFGGGDGAPALADKAFFDEFVALYVKPESPDPKHRALATMVEKVKCNVCHVGLNRKRRNAYGEALAQLLSRKTDTENKAKIQAALKKVAQQRSNPKDPNSPTFGERIEAGKLPAGEPEG